MKNKKTVCNLIIIDASGSMANKKDDVIGSIKTLFDNIKENSDVNHRTIVCDFSSHNDFRVLVNTGNSKDLKNEIANSYSCRSATALYDAINYAFHTVPTDVDGVIVNIITDGAENDSRNMSQYTLKNIIEAKREKGWVITYMGTSQEEMLVAKNIGIATTNTMVYDNSGSGFRTAAKMSKSVYNTYTSNVASDVSFNNDTLLTDTINTTTGTNYITVDEEIQNS